MSVEIPETTVNPAEIKVKRALEITADLRQFSGGDERYTHWLRRITYTEGIKYLAETCQSYWLIDLIASHQPNVLRKIARAGDRDFQVWEVRCPKEGGFVAVCHNGKSESVTGEAGKIVYCRQNGEYTDFPLESIKLYVVDGVLLLPSEY